MGSNKPLGPIPKPTLTYQRVGDMNIHQVAIGETTGRTRGVMDSTGIMDYGSLMLHRKGEDGS